MTELSQLIKESFEYNMTNVHTAFPGSVEKYDPKTRRADIQPYLKRKLPDGKFMNFPVIPDVPILFFGSKKYTVHFPLEKDDEVLVLVCERSTDKWRDSGGKEIEDTDPRRFNLMDCSAIPGLQPQEFIAVEDEGLNIVHKTAPDGDLISRVQMDDNHVDVKYKDSVIDMKKDVIEATNGKCTIKLNGDKVSIKNKGKSVFKIITTLWDKIKTTKPTTLGSPAQHNWNPAIEIAIETAKSELGMVMEE